MIRTGGVFVSAASLTDALTVDVCSLMAVRSGSGWLAAEQDAIARQAIDTSHSHLDRTLNSGYPV
ncbi:MAG: hypothetical protein V3U76_15055 [Granulosicoccus sp.]